MGFCRGILKRLSKQASLLLPILEPRSSRLDLCKGAFVKNAIDSASSIERATCSTRKGARNCRFLWVLFKITMDRRAVAAPAQQGAAPKPAGKIVIAPRSKSTAPPRPVNMKPTAAAGNLKPGSVNRSRQPIGKPVDAVCASTGAIPLRTAIVARSQPAAAINPPRINAVRKTVHQRISPAGIDRLVHGQPVRTVKEVANLPAELPPKLAVKRVPLVGKAVANQSAAVSSKAGSVQPPPAPRNHVSLKAALPRFPHPAARAASKSVAPAERPASKPSVPKFGAASKVTAAAAAPRGGPTKPEGKKVAVKRVTPVSSAVVASRPPVVTVAVVELGLPLPAVAATAAASDEPNSPIEPLLVVGAAHETTQTSPSRLPDSSPLVADATIYFDALIEPDTERSSATATVDDLMATSAAGQNTLKVEMSEAAGCDEDAAKPQTEISAIPEAAVAVPSTSAGPTTLDEASGIKSAVRAFCPNRSREEQLRYFHDLINCETAYLTETADKWEEALAAGAATVSGDVVDSSATQPSITDEGTELIHVAVGQARLFRDKKLQQFVGLVECYELERPTKEGPTPTPIDLAGFWEMIFAQVIDIRRRFGTLDQLAANSWIAPEVGVASTSSGVRSKKASATSSRALKPLHNKPKIEGKSNIREAIERARREKANAAAVLVATDASPSKV
ncbi:hypothetical protein BV898_15184 [Hypsibius exemplaris]|uniref:Disks large-associated protein 5 n=1 Tax=Hypsibius exemplaris TaxID=2072580 RepID=A0A9X6RK43_HYPEX|nr:hypothetical protein BV898_15184 [Hypsibius exemplaris]